MHAAEQRLKVLKQHLLPAHAPPTPCIYPQLCRADEQQRRSEQQGHKPVITAREAAEHISDDATVTVGGFVGIGFPEALAKGVRQRFDQTQHPQGLELVVVAACGNGKGRGLDVLAAEGLLRSMTYGWAGLSPALLKMVHSRKVAGWNLPLGVVSHMIRDTAAHRLGPITHVGLGTFCDPREQGGKVGNPDLPDKVFLVNLDGRELLHYAAPRRIDVALVRGTTADLDGNVSYEREALYLDGLNQAMAAHNSGGRVIVQVERIVDRGTIPARDAHIPGALVDAIVVAAPDNHWQSLGWPEYLGSLSGELRVPISHIQPLPMNERKVIAHRCMLLIDKPHSIVNLGIGMPEGVATVCTTHAHHLPDVLPITLSTEAGAMGGIPVGGLRFGSAHNAASHMPCASMIDFVQGGGLDVTCLGMAEVDEEGNVNVSHFPPRSPGCGGFIDISTNARRVIFAGTFTSGGLQVRIERGRLNIKQEGRNQKFRPKVQEKTFAAAAAGDRDVFYVTERAVLKLVPGKGIELMEVAPGIDVQRDVLDQMGFKPLMREVKDMDRRIFKP